LELLSWELRMASIRTGKQRASSSGFGDFFFLFLFLAFECEEKKFMKEFRCRINGSGVLVDPPVGTRAYLAQHGVKNTFIQDVILTHCHADHDSGILEMILQGDKMHLYTSKTVHNSYRRKTEVNFFFYLIFNFNFNPVFF
jgi:glyoxylase-like metal-dependent hydrolase (beta-lactamase superfamily II)